MSHFSNPCGRNEENFLGQNLQPTASRQPKFFVQHYFKPTCFTIRKTPVFTIEIWYHFTPFFPLRHHLILTILVPLRMIASIRGSVAALAWSTILLVVVSQQNWWNLMGFWMLSDGFWMVVHSFLNVLDGVWKCFECFWMVFECFFLLGWFLDQPTFFWKFKMLHRNFQTFLPLAPPRNLYFLCVSRRLGQVQMMLALFMTTILEALRFETLDVSLCPFCHLPGVFLEWKLEWR